MIFFQNLVESLKLRRPPRPRSSLLRLVKEFHEGWFVGEVTDIFVSGGMKKIRRCTYSDGDAEDLTLSDLKQLAKLSKRFKPSGVTKETQLSLGTDSVL